MRPPGYDTGPLRPVAPRLPAAPRFDGPLEESVI